MNKDILIIVALLRRYVARMTPGYPTVLINTLERFGHGQASLEELQRVIDDIRENNAHVPEVFSAVIEAFLDNPAAVIGLIVQKLAFILYVDEVGFGEEVDHACREKWVNRIVDAIESDSIETLPKLTYDHRWG